MRGLILSAVAGVATLVAFAMPSTAEAHGYGHGYHHSHYRGGYGYYRGPVIPRAPIVVPPVAAYRWGVGAGAVAPYPAVGAYGGFGFGAATVPFGGVRVYGGFAGGVAAPYGPVGPRCYP